MINVWNLQVDKHKVHAASQVCFLPFEIPDSPRVLVGSLVQAAKYFPQHPPSICDKLQVAPEFKGGGKGKHQLLPSLGAKFNFLVRRMVGQTVQGLIPVLRVAVKG